MNHDCKAVSYSMQCLLKVAIIMTLRISELIPERLTASLSDHHSCRVFQSEPGSIPCISKLKLRHCDAPPDTLEHWCDAVLL